MHSLDVLVIRDPVKCHIHTHRESSKAHIYGDVFFSSSLNRIHHNHFRFSWTPYHLICHIFNTNKIHTENRIAVNCFLKTMKKNVNWFILPFRCGICKWQIKKSAILNYRISLENDMELFFFLLLRIDSRMHQNTQNEMSQWLKFTTPTSNGTIELNYVMFKCLF